MTHREELLDAMIDRAIEGNSPEPGTHDPELAELLNLAQEVRQLSEPAWPGDEYPQRLSGQVVQRLQASPDESFGNENHAGVGTDVVIQPRIKSNAPESPDLPTWRRRTRQITEMLAAAIVLVLITGGLILAYQNLIGDEEPDLGPAGDLIPGLSTFNQVELADDSFHVELITIGGQDYGLFLTSPLMHEPPGSVTLRIVRLDSDGGYEEIGTLDAPDSWGPDTVFVPLGNTRPIALDGERLFVPLSGINQRGLWIVDVSDPENPVGDTVTEQTDTLGSFAVKGNLLAAARPLGSVALYDVSNGSMDDRIGYVEVPYRDATPVVSFRESHLYVAHSGGVAILDVSDPADAEMIGSFETDRWQPSSDSEATSSLEQVLQPGHFMDIAFDGHYAYVSGGTEEYLILDISDPTDPVEVDWITREDRTLRLAGSDGFLYTMGTGVIEDGDREVPANPFVETWDISDPAEPDLIERDDRLGEPFEGQTWVLRDLLVGEGTLLLWGGPIAYFAPIDWEEPDDGGEVEPAPTAEVDSADLPSGVLTWVEHSDDQSIMMAFDPETGETFEQLRLEGDMIAPSWSPDGERVAYISDVHVPPDVRSETDAMRHEVYVATADGSTVDRVTDIDDDKWPSHRLDWSPDGLSLVFAIRDSDPTSDAENEIVVVDLNRDSETVLIRSHATLASPRWSPDGSEIVFALMQESIRDENQRTELMITNPDGTDVRTIVEGDYLVTSEASWSPDGEWIAHRRGEFMENEIFLASLDGSEQAPLLDDPVEGRHHSPTWSPDGRFISFAHEFREFSPDQNNLEPPPIDVYAVDVEERTATLVAEDTYGIDPFWSPDGAYFAFTVAAGGDEQRSVRVVDLYIVTPDGEHQQLVASEIPNIRGVAWRAVVDAQGEPEN